MLKEAFPDVIQYTDGCRSLCSHAGMAQEGVKRLSKIEKKIDHLAAQLLGLGAAELLEVRKSLSEHLGKRDECRMD